LRVGLIWNARSVHIRLRQGYGGQVADGCYLFVKGGSFRRAGRWQLPKALNLSKDVKGAVIAEIDADSPAAKAGLREGDVIQEVNKQPVKNAKDLVAISKKLKPNEKILIRVWSQGRSGYVALELK
jgi:S1-C subfamily serine protease